MKNAMIGGLTALFATGCILAHSASAQPLTPLANHQSGAITLVGWGDNGQGGGYGGTPSGNSNSGGQQQNNSGYGGSQPENQGGGYGGNNNNSGNQGGTYNNNNNQGGTYNNNGNQGGTYNNNNNQGDNNQGGSESGQSGSNGTSSGSSGSSGGNKAKQAVCLGHCHDDCKRDAIANHLFKIPQVCLDSCKQRCQ